MVKAEAPQSARAAGEPVPATVSMTGFASRRGGAAQQTWLWDIRSVNGKGLDIRLRLPDGIDGLEQAVRAATAGIAQRGSIAVSLRLSGVGTAALFRPDPAALAAALAALRAVEEAAIAAGLSLTPASAADVLGLRGILDQATGPEDTSALSAALLADFNLCLADFAASRAAEGQALARIIATQIGRIAALTADAALAAEARRPAAEQTLRENLARVMQGAPAADAARVAQELAMLAVKADVTEEIDRLTAHAAAARALMAEDGAVGRKLDFLMQEFMREANTLCSKSGDRTLTRIGLDLKTVIDQMREQVQNVE